MEHIEKAKGSSGKLKKLKRISEYNKIVGLKNIYIYIEVNCISIY